MKEKKTPEKELNKVETNNLLDAEFKTLVIKMLNKLRGKVDELSENFNKETGNKRRNHKKEPVRNEDYTTESTVGKRKERIKSEIWKIRKQKTPT